MDVAHEPKTNRGEGWKELWQRNYFDLAFSLLGFEKNVYNGGNSETNELMQLGGFEPRTSAS